MPGSGHIGHPLILLPGPFLGLSVSLFVQGSLKVGFLGALGGARNELEYTLGLLQLCLLLTLLLPLATLQLHFRGLFLAFPARQGSELVPLPDRAVQP